MGMVQEAWLFGSFRYSIISPFISKGIVSAERDESPLKNYLDKTQGLTWLHKKGDAGDYFKKLRIETPKYRLLANPDLTDCPFVYAILPGNLALHQVHNCAPDDETVSSALLLETVFTVEDDPFARRLVALPGNSHFSVN